MPIAKGLIALSKPSLLFASLSVLSLALASPAFSQTPVLTDATQAPLALARPQPSIPSPVQTTYPGVIRYHVDITDRDRRIISVRQSIPVQGPGPLTLLYPKFLPGNHAATGPIQLLAGLTITAGRDRIEWQRDTLDPYAFHLEVPANISEIDVSFQWLTQSDNANWRVVMTQSMVNLQWEKAILYPAGYAATGITVVPTVTMPAGWNFGVALDTETFENGTAIFKPVDLYTLVDSPMFAGAHFGRFNIDRAQGKVHLNVLADEAMQVAPTEAHLDLYRNLVDQTDRLFGARHFDRYEFLFALTSQLGGIGLEHHRSSENTGAPDFFTAWDRSAGNRSLLPHEYAHSWNGKHMRPADELTANYNIASQNTLMWVYEGQTQYWGEVLSARAGLHTQEEALIALASVAAFYENQPGREWRALQDTNNHNLLGYRIPGQWPSWMRGTGDYYREALLIWLDADTLIREGTADSKSLDDFAKAFFGRNDGIVAPEGYRFEDLVAALNSVHSHDWARFLRTRLDAVGPAARAPLDGLERGGYRLSYVDSLTPTEKRVQSGWASDFQYSLGFSLSGPNNRIGSIRWNGPAFTAGIGAGWDLVAVNETAATPEILRQAVTAAKGNPTPISLLIRSGSRYRTVTLAYHQGLRYPRLERIEGRRDRLSEIFAARSS
jgi:predicted metalloprotease with PDZ domain